MWVWSLFSSLAVAPLSVSLAAVVYSLVCGGAGVLALGVGAVFSRVGRSVLGVGLVVFRGLVFVLDLKREISEK